MARTLQIHNIKVSLFVMSWIMLMLSTNTGCVVSPPIEAEPAEINQAPFVDPDFVIPADQLIVVTEPGEIEIGATRLFDPNAESVLHYVFIGQRGGLLKNAQAPLSPDQEELYRGVYFRFDAASYRFDPCGVRTRDAESETIFLYVSDRPFVEVTNNSVIPDENAFLASWAWVFELQEGACLQ